MPSCVRRRRRVSDLREADVASAAVEAVYARFGRVDALAHLVGGWTGGTNIVDATDEPLPLDARPAPLVHPQHRAPPGAAHGGRRPRAHRAPCPRRWRPRPAAGMSAYAVGKAAEETLLAALAREVAGTGVTVNVVRVRTIDTKGVRARGSGTARAPR